MFLVLALLCDWESNKTPLYVNITNVGEAPRIYLEKFNAAIARLISSLPRLRSLELNLRGEGSSTAFGNMVGDQCLGIKAPASTLPSRAKLNSLKHVSYFPDADWSRVLLYFNSEQPNFGNFLWLFYLPSIETITATAKEVSLPLAWPKHPPIASSLRTLYLLQSHVDEESLETIFKALPNLETFEYHFECKNEKCPLERGPLLYSSKLGSALQRLKRSLKTLIITTSFPVSSAQEPALPYFGIIGNLGRLGDFLKLTKLHAPFVVLVGDQADASCRLLDVLPEALRELCCTSEMRDWGRWAWDQQTVLQQFKDYLRSETSLKLNTLELRTERSPRDWWYLIRHEISQLCEAAGVRLEPADTDPDCD